MKLNNCRMLVFNNLRLIKELNMPACATDENKSDKTPLSNRILPVPDTDFRDFLDEVDERIVIARKNDEAIHALRSSAVSVDRHASL